jgi:uncharacterized protein (TIGR02118 family)
MRAKSMCCNSNAILLYFISVPQIHPSSIIKYTEIPMVKLVALYKKPSDTSSFDEHYKNIHTPLVKKMPGLQKIEVAKISSVLGGENKYYILTEMYFESEDTLNASMASPEGKAAAKDLMGFAGGLVQMMIAEVVEND